MDQVRPSQPGYAKPVGGLVIVLFTALFIGGWLYVDMVRNELEAKIMSVGDGLVAVERRMKDVKPALNDGWRTFVSVNDEYQLDLPPGTRLSEGESSAYVIADEEADAAMPIAIIEIQPLAEKAQYEGQGGRLYDGLDKVYWMYPWQNEPWGPFERVADSFRVL